MALARKNLVVDAERVRALAQQPGLSESAAIREAVDHALSAGGAANEPLSTRRPTRGSADFNQDVQLFDRDWERFGHVWAGL